MYALLIIIISLLFGAYAWRNFKSALILLAGLLPVYLLRFSIGPLPTTLLEVLTLITIAIWIIQKKPDWQKIKSLPWLVPAGLFLLAASIGVFVATDAVSALGIWKAYFIEPILIAVIFATALTKKDWPKVFLALGVSAAILSLFGILQYATGLGIPTPWDIELRVTSLFDYPNALGLFLAPLLSYGIVQLFQKRDSTFWLGVSSLSLVAILLSQTEAALVAIPAALFIAMWLSPLSAKVKNVLIPTVLITTTVLIAFVPIVREKLLLQDYSGQVRISQWQETANLVLDRPLFGSGLNGYALALVPYHNAQQYEIFQYPHNFFLNIWVELGLLGLVAFFWLTVLVLRSTFSALRTSHSLAIFTALLTMTIHGLVDVPYFKNDLAIMTWILIAAFFTVNSTVEERHSNK